MKTQQLTSDPTSTVATNLDEKSGSTRRHIRGSIMLVAGRVLAILINFGVQVLTVRYLTKADYGIYAFALSISSILAVAHALGMDKAASRFMSVYLHERQYQKFWGMLSLMFGSIFLFSVLGLSIFFWALQQGYVSSLDSDNAKIVLSLAAWLALCNALDAVFISIFAVMASSTAIFVRRHLLGPLLKLAAAVAIIYLGGGVIAFAVGQLLASLIGVALCVFILSRLLSADHELRLAFHAPFEYPCRTLFRYSSSLLAGDIAFLLRSALVPIVLGICYATEEVARFLAVLPVARLIEFTLIAFSIQFLPQASRLAQAEKNEDLQHLYEQTVKWVSLLSFPLFAVAFIGADILPSLLFGKEYVSSGAILAWLSIAFFTNASHGMSLRVLRSSCGLRVLLLSDISTTLVAGLLVVSLTITCGAIGGAISVCGTLAFQSILNLWLVAKRTPVNPLRPSCWTPFLVGLAVCLIASGFVRLGGGNTMLVVVSIISSIAFVFACFWRSLQLKETLPELNKVPIVRRLFSMKLGLRGS